MIDFRDPELREQLAEAAYLRERQEDALIDSERSGDDAAQYFCLRWTELSELVRRPYQIAVAVALEYARELSQVG